MGIFGWDLPPGCTQRHIDEAFGSEGPCDVCGRAVNDCLCPECPHCEAQGDQKCYSPKEVGGCGLTLSPEQVASKAAAEKEWEETARADAEYEARFLAEMETYDELFRKIP